jgi:pimeloyl-ACP methyl ester carboxylesterase
MGREGRVMHGLAASEHGPADAPLVALVHGSMDRASGMRRVARHLPELRVVTYDRRGYGRSRALGGPFGIDQQVEDLLSVLASRPAIVFGHSLGGDIALAAAQRHPEQVQGVVAYESPMSWEPWWPEDTAGGDAVRVGEEDGPEAAAEAFARRMIGAHTWDRLPAATRAERRAEGAALVGELSDLRRRPPYDPARLSVPVVVARGERCAAHHQRGAEVLASRLAACTGAARDVIVVPDVGHGIHLEQPAAVADLVRRLAAEVHGAGADQPAVTEP